ncbi:archaetidylserine decarboxylase [Cronobacter turicensis]|uniref:archaetidylserine decarboxylase n=1 Tax=Cronobacter turicensis TaxID=413502 RepID=UPI0024A85B11|nr:archaetidylserine decarboxylase [Cronobacter turicensis]MDI6419417.1 archaetidylserine decarboxylase [Cronobacter turicensis]MDI6464635.1 archaetidylserine decarboxylase [Cronobacter turicensis]MDI7674847.1 archaetidylserine decarboxylase [Cronobacter turicensis]
MSLPQRLFVLMQYTLPQHLLSRLTGRIALISAPWFKTRLIRWFIRRYHVDMREARDENIHDYAHFNAFFIRRLKAECRPVAAGNDVIVSPADGLLSQAGDIHEARLFQAKGHEYTLKALLGGNEKHAAAFHNGSFATVYLSPGDYHRVHMPATGVLREMVYVPGKLFSVNQTTVSHIPGVFARNERVICFFDTDAGPMAIVLVGAMIVASVETVWAGVVNPPGRKMTSLRYASPLRLEKGDELGHFHLGSTVIVLFGEQRVRWNNAVLEGKTIRYGEALGRATAP